MKRKDLLGLSARLGVVVAAFALIVGIIEAPVLPRLWAPAAVVAQRSDPANPLMQFRRRSARGNDHKPGKERAHGGD